MNAVVFSIEIGDLKHKFLNVSYGYGDSLQHLLVKNHHMHYVFINLGNKIENL